MKKLLYIILIFFIFTNVSYSLKIDDFEGGVDWGASPWNDEFPRFNSLPTETAVDGSESISPEWYWQYNDQTAGYDFGYIQRDTTTGANGTNSSLKATVTGGSQKDNQSGITSADIDGYGTSGSFVVTGLPIAGQTFTVIPYGQAGQVFTFQTEVRSGTGEVQIGSTPYETSQNMANAINADLTQEGFHASATDIGMTGVVLGGRSDIRDAARSASVSETASNILFWATLQTPDGVRQLYETYPDMLATVPSSGLPYVYYGSGGGNDSRNLNNSEVIPPSITPAGSNRMTLYSLNPKHGHTYGTLLPTLTVTIGSYIGDASLLAVNGSKAHYYHHFANIKSNYWTKMMVTEKPDVLVGVNPVYIPNDPTWLEHIHTYASIEYPMHYMECFSHFYYDLAAHSLTTETPPWSVWLDEIEIYTETRTENNELVGNRSVGYNGNGEIHISWTGPLGTIATGAPVDYNAQAWDYKIYYAKSVVLNESNFTTSGTLAGTFTKGAHAAAEYIGVAEFTIPAFDTAAEYSFAISPVDAPATAGFIEYTAGDPYSVAETVYAGVDQAISVNSATISGTYANIDPVTSCTWSNDRTGSGTLTATGGTITGTVTGLSSGVNVITITINALYSDTVSITYTPQEASNAISISPTGTIQTINPTGTAVTIGN